MTQPHFDLSPGRTLGPYYHIVEYLGGGWEGEVYKVEERRTGIIRAAKLFYNRKGVSREPLLRYARKLYKLRSCPIVVQYHHRGTTSLQGNPVDFLVSDYVDGEMLSSFLNRCRGKHLSSFEALHLLYALTVGIEQIHFLGEYHGDIHSDNIMVKRRGLGFEVYLIDFFDLGRPTREKIQYDVFDLITVFYEMIGGAKAYRTAGKEIKSIIMGRKHYLIRQRFKMAGHLRLALENLEWKR
jgi:tRNA A-37 threonylcarbamoyl transferase component Bud32